MIQLRPVAALVIVALIGAGCGSSASSDAGSATSTSTATKQQPTNRDKAVEFAECMRDNGVSGFPDPDASGTLTIDGVLNGSSLNPDSAEWKKAISACRDLQPAGFTGRKATASEQQLRLKFAQCIRENGVSDFPDPAEGDPIVDTNKIPSANRDGGMSALNAAMKKCGDIVASLLDDR